MKGTFSLFLVFSILFSLFSFIPVQGQISEYNVIWNSTSADSRGSMPIGNGDIGLNVWVQADGLYFYIGKTDAWDQYSRLLKVGKVKIVLNPNPFTNSNFQQILDLQTGSIIVSAGGININLWVDANNPAIYIDIFSTSGSAFSAQAEIIVWRTTLRQLSGNEASGAHGVCETPYETPDTIVNASSNVVWYHRNSNNATAWIESLLMMNRTISPSQTDPLYNLTFGGILSGVNMKKINATAISGTGASVYNISVVVLTSLTKDEPTWINAVEGLADSLSLNDPVAHSKYKMLHELWWEDLWAQSFVYLNASTYRIGQWYALQRWQDACGGGRGVYPIKFNGLIFVTDYYENNVLTYNADYRAWGGGYWFQNTRFPYWAMLANGDFSMMEPLFNMYLNAIPVVESRSEVWFGHPGGFFSETLFFWGTFEQADYGCGYNKIPIWNVGNTYMRYHVNGGLELLAMLLAHYAYTQDAVTAQKYLIPLAVSQMNYFNYHFQQDANGHKCFTPSQAIETWQEAMNPLPDIAGLKWVLSQLVTLPFITPDQKSNFNYLLGVLPSIPTGTNSTGASILLPAQSWLADSLHNSENPELYAVFPFPLYGVSLPNIDIAINTYWQRRFKCQRGWCQDVLDSALLGLVGETQSNLLQRVNVQPGTGYRFPTFVGPFFDYLPEEDHTSVAQLAVQYMLLQTRGDTILLFPAWPSGWDVHFKLFTAQKTSVEVNCVNGKITFLSVIPASRRSNVQIVGNSCTL